MSMGEVDGVGLVQYVKTKFPEIKIIVLSMIEDLSTLAQAFQAGANGYLIKSGDYNELIFAIKEISQGRKYLVTSLGL